MARTRIVGTDGRPIKAARRDSPSSDLEGSGGANRQDLSATVAWLKDEIDLHERTVDKFHRRGRKIYKKYKDVRSPREETQTRYNILWANVQTRLPALFARSPKAVVERRYKDKDPIGRTASEILERAIDYTLEQVNDFYYAMRLCMLDFELPGLAGVWIRYEPHFHKAELTGADETKAPEADTAGPDSETVQEFGADTSEDIEPEEEPDERITYEETFVDYVNWDDLGWSWARTWTEVRLFWKRTYLDRAALRKRFGGKGGLTDEEINLIPLDWAPKNLNDTTIKITRKKAIVYEIWDKQERCRYWVVKNFHKCLDERDDALGLQGFFPCPRPLMANMTPDELVPTPNFNFYQDQASEIDELSTRIAAITKALKVAGIYDASAAGLDRLLAEGVENNLIPVAGWAAMKEKGGLAGAFELMPLKEIAETLGYLRDQRTQLIEDVYQLTGIADIIRGFSDPNETAMAQQMKGQFSMLRMQDSQQEVQRFCRDVVRIVGQIVAGYDIETLKQISGVKLLTNAEKAQLQAQVAQQKAAAALQAQAAQQPPGGPAQGPGAAPGVPPGGAPAPQMTPQERAQIMAMINNAIAAMQKPRTVKRDASGRIATIA